MDRTVRRVFGSTANHLNRHCSVRHGDHAAAHFERVDNMIFIVPGAYDYVGIRVQRQVAVPDPVGLSSGNGRVNGRHGVQAHLQSAYGRQRGGVHCILKLLLRQCRHAVINAQCSHPQQYRH